MINKSTKTIWKSSFSHSNRLRRHFQGAAVDTGAQSSVTGKRQAIAYCKFHGIPFRLQPSAVNFKFGDGGFASEGTFGVRIPTPDGSFIRIQMNVVDADIPMLLAYAGLKRPSSLQKEN